MSTSIKSTHKAVQAYYEGLKAYAGQDVSHEGAVSTAFQNLLAEVGKLYKWVLIPQLTMKVKGHQIRPDGTLRHEEWMIPRGFWEAKDTEDDLDVEIRKKISKGYPTFNIIFEDTRAGVLYQNGREVYRAKLSEPEELVAIVNQFFNHTEKDIEGFEQAVVEFQDRIPHLGKGLQVKIEAAHQDNARFRDAFDSLLELCQTALNPNISVAAVDEMLVQHLLTERLFDRIFQDQDFTRRNVIAAEIEKVIDALVSQSFNRSEFMRSLDPFYKVIEDAARTIEDFTEKQHFLNTVYGRFFQGYSVRVADTHGIIYTTQQIANFMCASVEAVLKGVFDLTLGSPNVYMLDPCTGTGNFAVNMMRRVAKKDLPRFYRQQLFANEVMLLPYYVAAQNTEHEFYELTGKYEPFEGLCFVDTLDMTNIGHVEMVFMTAKNTSRIRRQRETPITIILGNPPYNVGQINENDNNKNRRYKSGVHGVESVDERVRKTYARDSKATSVSKLNDPYVKFFRWASDRLSGREGIVCFVSNNSFVDKTAFDGMRKHLLEDFTRIYHLDLCGNVRENPKLSGTAYNVFGIQVGVGITIAIRSSKHDDRRVYYHRVPEEWRRQKKLRWLEEVGSFEGVEWTELKPDARNTWIVPENATVFGSFMPIGSKHTKASTVVGEGSIFWNYSLGVVTARDDVVYSFRDDELKVRVAKFVGDYNGEVDRYKRALADRKPGEPKPDLDAFVDYEKVKWSRDLKLDAMKGHYASYDVEKVRTCYYSCTFRNFVHS